MGRHAIVWLAHLYMYHHLVQVEVRIEKWEQHPYTDGFHLGLATFTTCEVLQ